MKTCWGAPAICSSRMKSSSSPRFGNGWSTDRKKGAATNCHLHLRPRYGNRWLPKAIRAHARLVRFTTAVILFKARREMEGAHLLIVNHHLLFRRFCGAKPNRLGHRSRGAPTLRPRHHSTKPTTWKMSQPITSASASLKAAGISFSAAWHVRPPRKARGIIACAAKPPELGRRGRGGRSVGADCRYIPAEFRTAGDLGDHFFQVIGQWLTMQGVPEPFTDTPVQATIVVDASWRELVQPAADRWLDELERLADSLADLAAMLRTQSSEWIPMAQEVEAFAARGVHMLHAVAEIAAAEDPDHVFWVEGRRQRHENHEFQVALSSAPLEVGSAIRRWLDEGIQSLVCCSAHVGRGRQLSVCPRTDRAV